MPQFTKIGIKKCKIPELLYKLLLKDYKRAKSQMREEVCVEWGVNCVELVDKEEECYFKNVKRTFTMDLR